MGPVMHMVDENPPFTIVRSKKLPHEISGNLEDQYELLLAELENVETEEFDYEPQSVANDYIWAYSYAHPSYLIGFGQYNFDIRNFGKPVQISRNNAIDDALESSIAELYKITPYPSLLQSSSLYNSVRYTSGWWILDPNTRHKNSEILFILTCDAATRSTSWKNASENHIFLQIVNKNGSNFEIELDQSTKYVEDWYPQFHDVWKFDDKTHVPTTQK